MIETDRLVLRPLTLDDAGMMLELLNDPDFLRYIGDRGVRTQADAREYILKGPMEMYAQRGFGPYLVERKADGAALGICGLIKRDFLVDVDLGFAFLPAYRSQGYAYESSVAVLAHAREALRMRRLVALVDPDNGRSAGLLERLGFHPEGTVRFPGEEKDVLQFAVAL